MGFAQWLWRLFFVYSGLIVAHVLLVTWLVHSSAAIGSTTAFPTGTIWLIALAIVLFGAAATWYCVLRIIQPLSELAHQVRTPGANRRGRERFPGATKSGYSPAPFTQMQRDLAGRLLQIQDNNERLQTVLSSMAEGVLAVGPEQTILLANEAARRLLDFATSEPGGRPLLAGHACSAGI